MPEAPFAVRALYEYQAEQDDDLPFKSGQKLTVDEVLDADWYHGYYTDTSGQRVEGIFPITYVANDFVPPARPSRGPTQTHTASATDATPTKTASAPAPAPASSSPDHAAQSPLATENKAVPAPEPAPAPVPAPAPAEQSRAPATSAPPPAATGFPKAPARPAASDDDWGDEDDDEEEEKTISLAPPKSTAPPEVTAEVAAEGAPENTPKHEVKQEEPVVPPTKVEGSQHQPVLDLKPHADQKVEPTDEDFDELPTERRGNWHVSSAEPSAESQTRTAATSTSETSSTTQTASTPSADASENSKNLSTKSPIKTEQNQPPKSPESEVVTDKEPDFKTRLARFNQGNTEEDKPKPAPKRTGTFRGFQPQENEEETVRHPGREEVFKPSMSLKERIAMLQQNQQEEQEAAEAAAAAEERRKQRRAEMAAEAEASRRARAELEAQERAEAEAEKEARAKAAAAKQAELEKRAEELSLHEPPEIPQVHHAAHTSTQPTGDVHENESETAPPPVPQPPASQEPVHDKTKDTVPDESEESQKRVSRLSNLPAGFGFGQPMPRTEESDEEETSRDAGDGDDDEDEAEARRQALRQRMARLANSSGGMNLGMIMGGGGFRAPGGGSGGGSKPERRRSLNYESMSPAEIEAAEARREAEESAPVSIMPGAAPSKDATPSTLPEKDHEKEGEEAAVNENARRSSVRSTSSRASTSRKEFTKERTDGHLEDIAGSPVTSAPQSPVTPSSQPHFPKSPASDKFHDANETHESGSISESAYDGDSEATDATATPLATTPAPDMPRPPQPPRPLQPPQPSDDSTPGTPRASVPSTGFSETSGYESDEDTDRAPSGTQDPISTRSEQPTSLSQALGQRRPSATEAPVRDSTTTPSHAQTLRSPPLPPSAPAVPHADRGAPPPPPAVPHADRAVPPPPPTVPHSDRAVPPAAPAVPRADRNAPPPPPPSHHAVEPPQSPRATHEAISTPPAGERSNTSAPAPPSDIPWSVPGAHPVLSVHGHGAPRAPPPPPVPQHAPQSPTAPHPPPPVPPHHPAPPPVPHQGMHPAPPAPPAVPPTAPLHSSASGSSQTARSEAPPPPSGPAPPPRPPHAHPVPDVPGSSMPRTAPPPPPDHHAPALSTQTSASGVDLNDAESYQSPVRHHPPPPAPVARPSAPAPPAPTSSVPKDSAKRNSVPPPAHPPPSHPVSHSSTFSDTPAGVARQNSGRRGSAPDSRRLKEVSARTGPQVLTAAHRHFPAGSDLSTARKFLAGIPSLVIPEDALGVEIYANFGNASVQQVDEIRPGDVCVFEDATFQGSKGPLQKFNKTYQDAVFLVESWDGTKKKLHFADTKKEALRVTDLRMGVVRIYRAVDQQYLDV